MIEIALESVSDGFFLLLKIFSFYFAAISLFGLLRPKKPPQTEQQLRFAVLIPARNEESCIAGSVESLLAQDYPAELMDIYVIPNNCTDDTAGAARRAGARVLEVTPTVRSKGGALREAAQSLLAAKERYDAFCVFDADNEADPHFLSAMNQTLCTQARVAKSRILAKNPTQSWVCACYDIYFCFANVFLNRARSVLGLSARLIGTGFGVRREVLEEFGGFPAETITEDAEFFVLCAEKGEKIAFCEDAVTYDEEPLSFHTSLVQRRRWMSGIMQVAGAKAGALLRSAGRRSGGVLALDALLQVSFGYVQALIPLGLALRFAAGPLDMLSAIPLTLGISYGGAVIQAAGSLLLQRRLSWAMLPGVLLYPLFIFSFLPLQTLALVRRTTEWREIRHTGVRRAPHRQKQPVLPTYRG